jgi:hypothetical protein
MSVSPKIAQASRTLPFAWIGLAALFLIAGCKGTPAPENGAQPNAANPADTSSEASGSSTPTSSSSAQAGSTAPATSSSAQQAAAPQPAPAPIVIPAGKILRVTVDQPISSTTANPGDRFDASLDEPVVVHGREVLRRGTRVLGVITSAKSAGRFKGHAELGLALESVVIDGRRYRLHTSSVAEATKGRGKRTAIGGGGGAAFGAIIGAIAGGGKGAAIGALAGGGAGTAGAAFTGKRDIEIPAEARLDFKLAAPVRITPKS